MPDDVQVQVWIDGRWLLARAGSEVRVRVDGLAGADDDQRVLLHVFSHEGRVVDVVDDLGDVTGTDSITYDELIARLEGGCR
jgi:hypothetical protein